MHFEKAFPVLWNEWSCCLPYLRYKCVCYVRHHGTIPQPLPRRSGKHHSLIRGVSQQLLAFDCSDGAGYGRGDFEQGSLERRKRRAIVMKDTAGNDDGVNSLNTISQEEESG